MRPGIAGTTTVGRDRELARIAGRLAEVAAGRGGVVLLSGEPGIGKTRLALDAVAAAATRAVPVAWGRCPEAGAAPALWPWIQVVRDVVVDDSGRDVLALLETGDLRGPDPGAAELIASRRFRLLDGVVRLLAGVGPLVVVLEDLHRADELSVALARQLGEQAGRLPVLLLATYRPAQVPDGGALAAALAELLPLPWCDDLPLGPLPADDAERLVTSLPDCALDSTAVDTVVARAEGNPLFLQQLARTPDGAAAVPRSLREVIRARMAGLPERCRDLLDVLAVAGREVDLARAADAAEQPLGRVVADLSPAVASGLLVVEPAGRSATFQHSLLQETLYAEMNPSRRADLHERYAELLAGPAGDDPSLRAAWADHALRAAHGGRAVDCVVPLRAAARAAADRLAFAEAGRLLGAALAEVRGDSGLQAALLLELGEADLHAGRSAAARAHLERAADLAASRHDAGLLASAALGIGACVVTVGQVDWGLVARLRQALDGDVAPDVRVRLLARLAVELYWDGGGDEARRVSAEALDAAEARADDQRTLAEALWARLFTLRGPDRLGDRLEIGRRLVDVAVREQDDDVESRGRVWWLPELLQSGDLPAYRANVARLDVLARRSGQPLHRWYAELFAAQQALVEGDPAHAEALVESAAAVAARLGTGAGEIYRLAQQLVLRRDVGGIEELLGPVQAIADRYPTLVTLQMMGTVVRAEVGHLEEAAVGLSRLAADGFAAVPPDSLWTTTLCYAAEVARVVGDQRTARDVAARLAPYRGICAVHGIPVAWGAVDRAIGLARLTSGDRPAGLAELRAALELHRRWGMRPLVVRTRLDLAEALGSEQDGRALAERAAEEAAALGLARLGARAAALLSDGPPRLAGPGGTLSPRETEVLALVAAGVSNAGIAARLVLSVNTVERHVRNLYAKLGVANRAEASAVATRAQLPGLPTGSRSDHGFR